MTLPARRPWRRKKRWAVAGLVWLGFVYLFMEGPAAYAVILGWLPDGPVRTAYLPASAVVGRLPVLSWARESHRSWWVVLGRRHRPDVISYSGARGWKAVVTSDAGIGAASMTARRDSEGDTFEVEVGGHMVVIENVYAIPDGETKEGGRVRFDGRVVAELPAEVRRVSVEFLRGELAVEADGVRVRD